MRILKSWKTYLLALIFVPTVYAAFNVAQIIPQNKFMSLAEAKKLWGENAFDAEKFKTGDEALRASMAVDIIKNSKLFIGKTPLELREILGTPTGHYHFDMNPAYIISESDRPGGETWQILFLIDRSYKIETVKIHKN